MLRDSYTIWLREMKKFFAERLNLISAIIIPLFLIFVLGIGIESFADIKGVDIPYTAFLGPGIISIIAVVWGMSAGVEVIEDKRRFIKRLLVAPINRFSILVGKIVGTLTTQLILFFMIILALMLYNGFNLTNILPAIFMIILISSGFAGFGLLLASLFRTARAYQQVQGFLMLGVYFLSGAFFPVTNLPTIMKYVTYINPLTYGVDFVRWSLTGLYEINLLVDISVVFFFSITVIVYGSYLFDRNLRK